jgi:hypothetical protein
MEMVPGPLQMVMLECNNKDLDTFEVTVVLLTLAICGTSYSLASRPMQEPMTAWVKALEMKELMETKLKVRHTFLNHAYSALL